jgi:hypothetical protein
VNDAMQLRCHARECEGIWSIPHRRDPYRVSDIEDQVESLKSESSNKSARVESDGSKRSQTEPGVP